MTKGVTPTETKHLSSAEMPFTPASEPLDRRGETALRLLTMAGRLSAMGEEENAELIRRKLFSMGYFL